MSGLSIGAGIFKTITSADLSNDSSIEFTDLSSDFLKYLVCFSNVAVSAAASLRARTSSDNGVSFDSGAAHYLYGEHYLSSTGGGGAHDTTADHILLTGTRLSTDPRYIFNADVGIFLPSDAGEYTCIQMIGSEDFYYQTISRGMRLAAEAVSAIQFYLSAGVFVSGKVTLMGLEMP